MMFIKKMIKFSAAGMILCFSSAGFAQVYVIDQSDKSFVYNGTKIEKLEINVGDTVNFKNEDPFFHNIFSLSDLKTFDLGSFPKGEFKSVEFDKAGVVEIECAIHPQMYLELTVK